MRGLLIAAPASGQGKTTLTLGLLRALVRRGVDVASAKSGPDYIDPAFHAAATGRPCVTLDAWAAAPAQLRARAAAQSAELLVVEGAMGLYDGAVTAPLPDPQAAYWAAAFARAAKAGSGGPAGAPASAPRGAGQGDQAPSAMAARQSAPDADPDAVGGHGASPSGSRPPGDGRDLAGAGPASTGDAAIPGSAAALARALGLPVLLVLDVSRAGQGAAAIVHGLASYPGAPLIAGVILNRVGSPRHAAMVARAVEAVRPVLGVLPRRDDLAVPSRHLGLVQAGEMADMPAFLDRAADAAARGCDLDAILAAARPLAAAGAPARLPPIGQRIAVAQDAAFAFSYWHMLEDWRAAGAEVSLFSPLADQAPDPSADAVFLPGGYPELHPGRIAAAARFRAGVLAAATRGATIYGECGGFMVLGDGIVDGDGARHSMLGLLRLETSMERPKRILGYRRLTPLAGPWTAPLSAHEFHTAAITRQDGPALFMMHDAAGLDLGPTGLTSGRVSGSWAHVIEPAAG